tara:strand:+ start:520 stop:687 length:168 start_codon:yes stop_codon:yes gene_type:complete
MGVVKYTPSQKKRKYYDSLKNYIMTQLPMEHEKTMLQFVDKAVEEAYANGRQTGS